MTKVVYNACHGGFSLSEAASLKLGMEFWDTMRMDRHDPALVEIVETMGAEANGSYAELRIAEIEGDRYIIREYDGREWVETPEMVRWVVV